MVMGSIHVRPAPVGYGPIPNVGPMGNPRHRKQLAETELMAIAINGVNENNRYAAVSALEDVEYYLNINHDHTVWDVLIRYDDPNTALRDRIMFALERTALDIPYPNGVIARFRGRCRVKGLTFSDMMLNALLSGVIGSVVIVMLAYAYRVVVR